MRNRQLEAVRVIVATALVSFMVVASAQNVAALRQTSYDLPQTDLDREVLTLFFGAIDAVQGPCSASLTESIATERALAACATFGGSSLDTRRSLGELAFEMNRDGTPHTWLTPWQQAEGFGSVRRVALEGVEYFLAIDDGLAYVIRFLE